MTRFTRLLIWLLSQRHDVSVTVQVDVPEGTSRINYLEDCYGLDATVPLDRSGHGEAPP